MKAIAIALMIAVVLAACKKEDTAAKAAAEKFELEKWEDWAAGENAPLIAARHDLDVDKVRAILRSYRRLELARQLQKLEQAPLNDMSAFLPETGRSIDQISGEEGVPRRVVAEVVFDDLMIKSRMRE